MKKADLRALGITPETWDRERSGITFKREVLMSASTTVDPSAPFELVAGVARLVAGTAAPARR